MKGRRWVAAACLPMVIGAVAAFGGPAGARSAGPRAPSDRNINLSRRPGNQSETTVAINPTNPKNIVVVSNVGTVDRLFEAFTMDGGLTWTRRFIADGDALGRACCDPSLAFDRFGNLFLTYLRSTLPDSIPVALSTDGGATFGHVKDIASPSGPAVPGATPRGGPPGYGPEVREGFADQPTVTTGSGSVWVTFTAGSGRVAVAGAKLTGAGRVGRFGSSEAVAGTNGEGDFGDIAVGPGGKVLVAWQRPTSGEHRGFIYVSRDPDGLGPKGLTAPVQVTATNVGGFDYLPAQPNRSVDAEAGLAYDRSSGPHRGRAYLLYTNEQPDESNDLDVLIRSSDDDGATWSAPVRVNDDAGTNSQLLPKLALDPTTGNLAASWYDARDDLGDATGTDTDGIPNDDVTVYAAFSTSGGARFRPNIRVSAGATNADDANNGIDLGDYTGLAFWGGNAYPVWADNSNSTGNNPDGRLRELDVYTARVHVAT